MSSNPIARCIQTSDRPRLDTMLNPARFESLHLFRDANAKQFQTLFQDSCRRIAQEQSAISQFRRFRGQHRAFVEEGREALGRVVQILSQNIGAIIDRDVA